MIGNIHNNEFCKKLTQFASTKAVKGTFNKEMLKLGVDHKKYTPQRSNFRNKPLYAARIEKLERGEKAVKNKAIEIRNDLIKVREKHNIVKAEMSKLDILRIEIEKLSESFKKWVYLFKNNILKDTIEEAKNVIDSMESLHDDDFDLVRILENNAEILENIESKKREVRETEKISRRRKRRRTP